MKDLFDHDTYWALLDRIKETHRIVRFADLGREIPSRFVILRHDVDYSPNAALRLARLEADRGIRASYFLLVGCLYYSLLDPEYASIPAELSRLGHEVGLHYDVNAFTSIPEESWPELLERQAALLESLAGSPVRTVAMHQPGLNGNDPFRNSTEFTNAYADPWFREIAYFSDSCRAWRDQAWEALNAPVLPDRVQLVLHPMNWATHDREREQIFRDVHAETIARIETAEAILAERVARHAAVTENEARRKRSALR